MRVFIGLKPEHSMLPVVESPVSVHHPDDMHLTLAFIGECDSNRLLALKAEFAQLDGLPVCHWRSTFFGDFPSSQQAKVLAFYGEEMSDSLRQVVEAVSAMPLAAPYIRHPFRPHVTLAPIKKATGIQRPFIQDWQFSELCLYQSTSSTPKYNVLVRWPLL